MYLFTQSLNLNEICKNICLMLRRLFEMDLLYFIYIVYLDFDLFIVKCLSI